MGAHDEHKSNAEHSLCGCLLRDMSLLLKPLLPILIPLYFCHKNVVMHTFLSLLPSPPLPPSPPSLPSLLPSPPSLPPPSPPPSCLPWTLATTGCSGWRFTAICPQSVLSYRSSTWPTTRCASRVGSPPPPGFGGGGEIWRVRK